MFTPEDLKAIRSGLIKDYPVSDAQQGVGIEISAEGGVRQQSVIQRHVFATLDESHQVGLSTGSIVLEAKSGYEGFEAFLGRWLKIVETVSPVIELNVQMRLGLRYVNQLVVENAAAGLASVVGRINPALVTPFGSDDFPYNITTSFQEVRLSEDDGHGTLRHGLQVAPQVMASGFPGDPASPRGFYTLDIDFFDDVPKDFGFDAHKDQLAAFNRRIWKLFRWAITDAEYEAMAPEQPNGNT